MAEAGQASGGQLFIKFYFKGNSKMDNSETKKGKILQFRFSPKEIERLDTIKKTSLASTRTEVVRSALRMYEFLVGKLDEGYSIQLKKEDETVTVVPV